MTRAVERALGVGAIGISVAVMGIMIVFSSEFVGGAFIDI